MKLRRGSGKTHHGPKRKAGTRDVAAARQELADDDSPMSARLRKRAASSATFDELMDGDFGELAASESERAGAGIVINVSSGRCRVFQDGAVYVLTDGPGGTLLKLTPNNSQTRQ